MQDCLEKRTKKPLTSMLYRIRSMNERHSPGEKVQMLINWRSSLNEEKLKALFDKKNMYKDSIVTIICVLFLAFPQEVRGWLTVT